MKHLTIIFLSLLLFGCKAPQITLSETKTKEDINIQNDIHLMNAHDLSVITDQVMKKLLNEKLNININQKKYDTDKPVNPETGHHPLKEENDINISKETNQEEETNIHQEKDSVATSELVDQSKIKAKVDNQTIDKKEDRLKTWQKWAIAIGLIAASITIYRIFK